MRLIFHFFRLLEVGLSLIVGDIKAVDHDKHLLTLGISMYMNWIDPRVSCKNQVVHLNMSENDIAPHLTQVSTCIEWLNENTRLWSPFPRIQRMEALDLKNTLGREMAALRLQTNGTYHVVVLQSQFDVTIGCPMRFGQFPFDEHVCDFGIEMADVSINFKEAVLVNEFPSEQAYNFSVGSF